MIDDVQSAHSYLTQSEKQSEQDSCTQSKSSINTYSIILIVTAIQEASGASPTKYQAVRKLYVTCTFSVICH